MTDKEKEIIGKCLFIAYLEWYSESYNAPLWKRIWLWFKYRWTYRWERKLAKESNR